MYYRKLYVIETTERGGALTVRFHTGNYRIITLLLAKNHKDHMNMQAFPPHQGNAIPGEGCSTQTRANKYALKT